MRNLLLLITLGSVLFACKPEPKSEVDTSQLLGNWRLSEATKNGNPTVMLGELYFTFDENGGMDTNMPTADEKSEYTLSGSTIEQRGENTNNDYQIESLTDNELILTTKVQNLDFRLVLNKE